RLSEPGTGDAHEARGLHLFDGRRPAVTHRLAHAADQLVHDRRERAFVGDAPLDAFWHKLVDVLDVSLEVSILRERPPPHRTERAHAAVLLEAFSLHEDHVTRRLFRAGE